MNDIYLKIQKLTFCIYKVHCNKFKKNTMLYVTSNQLRVNSGVYVKFITYKTHWYIKQQYKT